jgi:di/tricarboxylate transporter
MEHVFLVKMEKQNKKLWYWILGILILIAVAFLIYYFVLSGNANSITNIPSGVIPSPPALPQ